MRIFGHTVARMYISAIVLLIFLAGASSYLLQEFPYALIAATLACAIIEIAIVKYYQKQKFRIPFSGIITGLIIGCVAPINVPLLPILVACAIAIASKFFIKVKSANVFNPAALGLLALGLLSIGSSWWGTSSVNVYGVALSLSIVLVIAAYECRRLPLAFSFIIASVALSIAASPIGLGNATVAILGVNYFFAFLMLTEPKTSPPKKVAQAVYGIYVAVLYFALITLLAHSSIYFGALSIFAALLIGNITYAIYRKLGGIEGISGLVLPSEVMPKLV